MCNIDNLMKSIENLVCDFFMIPYSEAFSKNTKRDKVLVRHFVIFILHKQYKVSTAVLSKRYGHSERHIKYICACMKNHITYDKQYQVYKVCLEQLLKKGEC